MGAGDSVLNAGTSCQFIEISYTACLSQYKALRMTQPVWSCCNLYGLDAARMVLMQQAQPMLRVVLDDWPAHVA